MKWWTKTWPSGSARRQWLNTGNRLDVLVSEMSLFCPLAETPPPPSLCSPTHKLPPEYNHSFDPLVRVASGVAIIGAESRVLSRLRDFESTSTRPINFTRDRSFITRLPANWWFAISRILTRGSVTSNSLGALAQAIICPFGTALHYEPTISPKY